MRGRVLRDQEVKHDKQVSDQALFSRQRSVAVGQRSARAVPMGPSRGRRSALLLAEDAVAPGLVQLRERVDSGGVAVMRKPNRTGLPDRLKDGIESLSGYDLSGVRVNYNSAKAAQVNAHAYTQGQTIEVGPGQERHVPHEAWHVVQQMQGRVRPTIRVNGVAVNDNPGLEREADVMGQRALQRRAHRTVPNAMGGEVEAEETVQRQSEAAMEQSLAEPESEAPEPMSAEGGPMAPMPEPEAESAEVEPVGPEPPEAETVASEQVEVETDEAPGGELEEAVPEPLPEPLALPEPTTESQPPLVSVSPVAPQLVPPPVPVAVKGDSSGVNAQLDRISRLSATALAAEQGQLGQQIQDAANQDVRAQQQDLPEYKAQLVGAPTATEAGEATAAPVATANLSEPAPVQLVRASVPGSGVETPLSAGPAQQQATVQPGQPPPGIVSCRGLDAAGAMGRQPNRTVRASVSAVRRPVRASVQARVRATSVPRQAKALDEKAHQTVSVQRSQPQHRRVRVQRQTNGPGVIQRWGIFSAITRAVLSRARNVVQFTQQQTMVSSSVTAAVKTQVQQQAAEQRVMADKASHERSLAAQAKASEVKPVAMETTLQLPAVEEAAPAVESAVDEQVQDYLRVEVPPEVRRLSDEKMAQILQPHLAGPKAALKAQTGQLQEQRKQAITESQAQLQEMNATGQQEQEQRVSAARRDIEAEVVKGRQQNQTILDKFTEESRKEQTSVQAQVRERAASDQREVSAAKDKANRAARAERAKRQRSQGLWGLYPWLQRKVKGRPVTQRFFGSIARGVGRFASKAVGSLVKVAKKGANLVKSGFNAVKGLAKKVFEAGKKWIEKKVNAFGDWVSEKAKGVSSEFATVVDGVKAGVKAVRDAAVEGVQRIAQKVKAKVSGLVKRVTKTVAAISRAVNAAVKGAVGVTLALIKGDYAGAAKIVLESICEMAGIKPEPIYELLAKCGQLIGKIYKNPGRFFNNLLKTLTKGFNKFLENIWKFLKQAFFTWVVGPLSQMGVKIPERFDFKGILSVVLEVLGLTYANIRSRLVAKLEEHYPGMGERLISGIETTVAIVRDVIERGPIALWDRLKGYLGDLKEKVIGGIQSFLIQKVITGGIKWLLQMVIPGAGVLKAVTSVYDFIQLMRTQMERLQGFVAEIYATVSEVAKGVVGPSAQMLVKALVKALPVAIDFLARQLNISGLTKAVGGIIKKVTGPINKGIDTVLGSLIVGAQRLASALMLKIWKKGGGREAGGAGGGGAPRPFIPASVEVIKAHHGRVGEMNAGLNRLKEGHGLSGIRVEGPGGVGDGGRSYTVRWRARSKSRVGEEARVAGGLKGPGGAAKGGGAGSPAGPGEPAQRRAWESVDLAGTAQGRVPGKVGASAEAGCIAVVVPGHAGGQLARVPAGAVGPGHGARCSVIRGWREVGAVQRRTPSSGYLRDHVTYDETYLIPGPAERRRAAGPSEFTYHHVIPDNQLKAVLQYMKRLRADGGGQAREGRSALRWMAKAEDRYVEVSEADMKRSRSFNLSVALRDCAEAAGLPELSPASLEAAMSEEVEANPAELSQRVREMWEKKTVGARKAAVGKMRVQWKNAESGAGVAAFDAQSEFGKTMIKAWPDSGEDGAGVVEKLRAIDVGLGAGWPKRFVPAALGQLGAVGGQGKLTGSHLKSALRRGVNVGLKGYSGLDYLTDNYRTLFGRPVTAAGGRLYRLVREKGTRMPMDAEGREGLVEWNPGNIHRGPSARYRIAPGTLRKDGANNTREVWDENFDDGGSKFEEAAKHLMGAEHFAALERLRDSIKDFLDTEAGWEETRAALVKAEAAERSAQRARGANAAAAYRASRLGRERCRMRHAVRHRAAVLRGGVVLSQMGTVRGYGVTGYDAERWEDYTFTDPTGNQVYRLRVVGQEAQGGGEGADVGAGAG